MTGLGYESCPRNLEDTTLVAKQDEWVGINLYSQKLSGQKGYGLDIGHAIENLPEVFFFFKN